MTALLGHDALHVQLEPILILIIPQLLHFSCTRYMNPWLVSCYTATFAFPFLSHMVPTRAGSLSDYQVCRNITACHACGVLVQAPDLGTPTSTTATQASRLFSKPATISTAQAAQRLAPSGMHISALCMPHSALFAQAEICRTVCWDWAYVLQDLGLHHAAAHKATAASIADI